MSQEPILVADIGGTHARFGIVEPWENARPHLTRRIDFDSQDYAGFAAALRRYVAQAELGTVPRAAAIAAAGPVTAGRVALTNRQWSISESELHGLGFVQVALINDFAALAYSVETLGPQDVRSIGPEVEGLADSPVSIIGAGTGFGVSCLVRQGTQSLPLITEGGHIAFAPIDDQQIRILEALQRQFGRVSVERILSGPGLENLYRVYQQSLGRTAASLSAAELTTRALAGEPECRAILHLFCSIYGSVAGDIALAHGARGGVIVGGGIAQRIAPFLLESAFRRQFENKGRLSAYVKAIPTKLLLDPDAALRGAARAGLATWGC